jgi:hypothetical protein
MPEGIESRAKELYGKRNSQTAKKLIFKNIK